MLVVTFLTITYSYLCHGHAVKYHQFFRHTDIWSQNSWGYKVLGDFPKCTQTKLNLLTRRLCCKFLQPVCLTFNLNCQNHKHWINIILYSHYHMHMSSQMPSPNVPFRNASMPRTCRPWLWSDGWMGNAKPPTSKLSAYRIYSTGLVLFASSRMFQVGTNCLLLNIGARQAYYGDRGPKIGYM
jgi:hypothetical protein